MAQRDRPHIFLTSSPRVEPFTLASSGGNQGGLGFQGDRQGHGRRLAEEYRRAVEPAEHELKEAAGTYVSFVSFPGLELALDSLDVQRAGDQPELVAVRDDTRNSPPTQVATVYIPMARSSTFLRG